MSILGKSLRNCLRRAIVWLMAGVFAAALGGPGALAAPPANDECTGAVVVTPGAPAPVLTSNAEATLSADDPDLSCAMGPGFGSVFFTFTATATSARISTDLDFVGPDSDFAVYAVDQGDECNTASWTEKGCAEDDAITLDGNTSACIEGLVVDETYKIMLKSFTAASSGDYTIQIDSPCEGGPSAVCGDGVVEGAEQCDDGNTADGDGCSAICEIEGGPDNTPPVLTVPDDINVSTDPGLITAVVSFDATATDDSGMVTVTQIDGPASGETFPIGDTTVTFRAEDPSGNTDEGSFTVTVADKEDPVFLTVPGDIDDVVATSAAGAVVIFPFATAIDNSGIVTVTQITEPLSGETFPIGNTTVTFRAVDPSGNAVEASFTVTVLYLFGEFLPPLEDGKIYKTNRTLPVKFRITFAGGEPAEEVTVGIEVAMIGEGGGAGEAIDLSTNETADSGSVFRFTDGLYIYNLSTRGFAPGLYRITAILSDGQAPSIDIELR